MCLVSACRYHDFEDGMPERLLNRFKSDILPCTKLPLYLSYHFRGVIGNHPIAKLAYLTYIQFSFIRKSTNFSTDLTVVYY